ncbi:MAG: vanadium-dependent haloperoxidase [Lacibacter sp.]
MKNLLKLLFVIITCSCAGNNNKKLTEEPRGVENMAYKWGKIALEATANDTERFRPRPTVTSRMLALVWTAVFDAWSRYDSKANPVYLQNVDRVAEDQRTLKNKETAVSYAAYRAMLTYYFSDSILLKNKMKEFGFDPDNHSIDPSTPEGIGNLAAKAVIDSRMHDGSNQTGTMQGSNGTVYSDYTGYIPVNSADTLKDIKHWQPKYFSDGKGGKFAPACLTPHWGKVKPLLLDSGSQFRCQPPPAMGSAQLEKEIKEVVDMQANLTNEQKGLVEFMRDGPKSVQQAGHWFIFAQDVSRRDNHTLDQDVKMYFAVEAAAMDGFIACWDTKMVYDFARPYTLVHYYYKNKKIKGWGGPDKGMIEMQGQEWRPYSPETFLCPPFPSYISGHSSISGACAEILKLFTGNDHFGVEVKRKPGEMTEPNNIGAEVTLKFPTFTETANMAGLSRVLGGYHIQCENEEGLKLGRNVAAAVWKKYLYYTGEKI